MGLRSRSSARTAPPPQARACRIRARDPRPATQAGRHGRRRDAGDRQLATERQIGLGAVGPIPITAVWEYWRRKGVDDVAAEILTYAVLRGDRVYREKASPS